MKAPRKPLERSSIFAAPLILAALAASSCTGSPYGYGGYPPAPVQRGALTGAIAGGVIGAIATEDIGGIAAGAAIGALAGAGTGYVIQENQRRQGGTYGGGVECAPGIPAPLPPRPSYPEAGTVNPPAPPAPPRSESRYPTAEKTANPHQVISPYPPHRLIDIEGFHTGDLAIDPTTDKIFVVP